MFDNPPRATARNFQKSENSHRRQSMSSAFKDQNKVGAELAEDKKGKAGAQESITVRPEM